MKVTKSVGATKVTAYRGDAKTLLAFDIAEGAARRNLAGFTVHIQPQGGAGYYLWNDLTFAHPERHHQDAAEPGQSTLNAPIHKFRWVHVPGLNHQGLAPQVGPYTYTVTPRYFDDQAALLALDPLLSVPVTIDVGPFQVGNLRVGFTRGFVQSQAYVRRFGSKIPGRPRGGPLNFDTSKVGGKTDQGVTFTYEQQYEWLGFSARDLVFEILNKVRADRRLTLDVFAYDLNEPDVVGALLELGAQGRLRIILDNASLHHDPAAPPPEDEFEALLATAAPGQNLCLRGKFGRFAHDKVFVVRRKADGKAVQVLTGSTNLSVTGLYVNSNHVLVFDDAKVAGLYAEVFDEVWRDQVDAKAFKATDYAIKSYRFGGKTLPATEIAFSPHRDDIALRGLNAMVTRILDEAQVPAAEGSVLFAVMGLEGGAVNPVYDALKAIHKNTELFSYGVSDDPGGIAYYPVGSTEGVLVTGKPGKSRLPKPFSQVPNLGLGHQIHHKFVVCGFNGPDPVVYCGSSNLAFAGETVNGDNLLAIRDGAVATAFAIEALALVDHFNFLGRVAEEAKKAGVAIPDLATTATKRAVAKEAQWFLGTTDVWAAKFFDPSDLHCRDRLLFAD